MQKKIKIGVLFSQSGLMAIPESAHLRGVLLACEEINSRGGINGQLLDPIILDPAGDDRRYVEMATELLLKHRVNVIFGCCLSSSRKAVLPIIERFNGILFYPSVYEGFEYSPNVIYGGGVPNQLVLPLIEYVYVNYGRKIALIGHDYLYSREINRVVTEFSNASDGVIVVEKYLPFNVSNSAMKSTLRLMAEKKPDIILSTIVGHDNVKLYTAYADMGLGQAKAPIASLTAVESLMLEMDEEIREGHISIASYFASLKTKANKKFVDRFIARFGDAVSPCVFSEVAYSLVNIFANALHIAEYNDADSILSALSGAVFKSPGGDLFVDLDTNHFTSRPYIAMSNKSGQYDVLWKNLSVVKADPYLIAYDRSVGK